MMGSLFALVTFWATPDVVELVDGNRIVGTIVSGKEAPLSVLTPAGRVDFALDQCQTVERRAALRKALRSSVAKLGDQGHAAVSLATWCLDHGLYDEMFQFIDGIEPDPAIAPSVERLVVRAKQESLLGRVAPVGKWSQTEVTSLLDELIGNSKSRAQVARHWLLHASDRKHVGSALQSGLRRRQAAARSAVAELLGEMLYVPALNALVQTSLKDRDAGVRNAALQAVLQFPYRDLSLPYVRALASRDPTMRQMAYQALEPMAEPRAVSSLIKLLAPTAAGGSSGGPPRNHVHFGRQLTFVQDFEVEIAQGAVIADPVIGILRDGSTLDVKVAASSGTTVVERRVVSRLLTRLTGHRFGDDFTRWANWWNENGEQYLVTMLSEPRSDRRSSPAPAEPPAAPQATPNS